MKSREPLYQKRWHHQKVARASAYQLVAQGGLTPFPTQTKDSNPSRSMTPDVCRPVAFAQGDCFHPRDASGPHGSAGKRFHTYTVRVQSVCIRYPFSASGPERVGGDPRGLLLPIRHLVPSYPIACGQLGGPSPVHFPHPPLPPLPSSTYALLHALGSRGKVYNRSHTDTIHD